MEDTQKKQQIIDIMLRLQGESSDLMMVLVGDREDGAKIDAAAQINANSTAIGALASALGSSIERGRPTILSAIEILVGMHGQASRAIAELKEKHGPEASPARPAARLVEAIAGVLDEVAPGLPNLEALIKDLAADAAAKAAQEEIPEEQLESDMREIAPDQFLALSTQELIATAGQRLEMAIESHNMVNQTEDDDAAGWHIGDEVSHLAATIAMLGHAIGAMRVLISLAVAVASPDPYPSDDAIAEAGKQAIDHILDQAAQNLKNVTGLDALPGGFIDSEGGPFDYDDLPEHNNPRSHAAFVEMAVAERVADIQRRGLAAAIH